MACLEMHNNSQLPPPPPPPLSPRISFSNDFVESHHNNNNNNNNFRTELPPPSTDFEFSVTNFNRLTTADELFFKGRLLPYEDSNNGNNSQMQRTLRDELLVNDDNEGDFDFSLKPPKGSSSSSSSSSSNRWKGFLGLRKSHIGSKKPEKIDVPIYDLGKRLSFSMEDPNLTKSPQEMVRNNEGTSSKDMEMGI